MALPEELFLEGDCFREEEIIRFPVFGTIATAELFRHGVDRPLRQPGSGVDVVHPESSCHDAWATSCVRCMRYQVLRFRRTEPTFNVIFSPPIMSSSNLDLPHPTGRRTPQQEIKHGKAIFYLNRTPLRLQRQKLSNKKRRLQEHQVIRSSSSCWSRGQGVHPSYNARTYLARAPHG